MHGETVKLNSEPFTSVKSLCSPTVDDEHIQRVAVN
jgi:hypothetical protein